jgi:hypothetical protein
LDRLPVCDDAGLVALLVAGPGDNPETDWDVDPEWELLLLGGTSGEKDTPDCRMSSNLITISVWFLVRL